MARKLKRPALTLHKPTGQARVRIDGRDHYLGQYGSPEAHQQYDDLIADWLLRQDASRLTLTVDDLAILYDDHADAYYRRPDGEPSGEHVNVRIALRYLVEEFGRTSVREFGPQALVKTREAMIRSGMHRRSINLHVGRIRRMFKWAVEREMVPETVWRALTAVSGLKAGRSKARESEDVKPVSDATLQATLPHLSPVVADMVRLQLLTGMRPGELCAMRPGDVTRADGVWEYRPGTHKNSYRGKERRIFIGPQAQTILAPYLLRFPETFCFTPAESEARRAEKRRAARKTPLRRSQPRRARSLRERFVKDSYNRSIARASEAAFGMPAELRNIGRTVQAMRDVTNQERAAARQRLSREAAEWRRQHCWSPNQLRHSRATLLRAQFGIEAAAVVLGHSDVQTTTIYAERDFAKAAEIALQIG